MKYDPNLHHRRSIRLKGHDYSAPGLYFVTICTAQRQHLFGEIVDGQMLLNEVGRIIVQEWTKSAEIRQEIKLDEWVVMPNHFHAVVVIVGDDSIPAKREVPQRQLAMKPRSLSSLVAGFKSATTSKINAFWRTEAVPVWHRNYYERIIRDDLALSQVRRYIRNNPRTWSEDKFCSR